MRILAATPYYEPEGGGLERYAHEILCRLARRGHDVKVVCFTRTVPRDDEIDDVQVHRIRPRRILSNTPVDLSFRNQVTQQIATWRPHVMVAHTPVPFAAEMATSAARKAGLPYVVTYHAGRLTGGSAPLRVAAAVNRATLERRMLSGSRQLIAVSPYVRDHALRGHRERVTVIPPGVDANRFLPNGSLPGGPVLFVAPLDRAYRWKGLDVLREAFAEVRQRHPGARLHLVGEGDRSREVAAWAEQMAPSVRLFGKLEWDRLVEEYQNCSVTILPSTSDAEAFGMVLAEANACGRPVIGSRIGGIPDFVEDGVNGLLAQAGDAHHLATCISRVLAHPREAGRMGDEGRQRILVHHNWDALAARTELVLLETRNRPGLLQGRSTQRRKRL